MASFLKHHKHGLLFLLINLSTINTGCRPAEFPDYCQAINLSPQMGSGRYTNTICKNAESAFLWISFLIVK